MRRSREINRKMNAYFSVEAAMVMPLVISAILFAVSLFIFQYDRCLMEQDMAAQTLKAAVAVTGTKNTDELTEKVQLQTAELYRNKYVAWDIIMLEIEIKKGIIEAIGEGEFRFPMPGWNLWNRENIWSARAEYKAHRVSPITFIRNCRKIMGGI